MRKIRYSYIIFSINAQLNKIYNTMQELISSYNVHQLIIQAVCYMHRKNSIVHYDLKPRNVLVWYVTLLATVSTMSQYFYH